MKRVRLLTSLLLLACTSSAALAAATPTRFSKTLEPATFSALGLDQLSSDQLAVLDALIRRDIAAAHRTSEPPRAARFSERLTADERANAGFASLSETAINEIDASVERLIAPPVAPAESPSGSPSRAIASSSSGSSPFPTPTPSVKLRRDPEIHGEFALMVAVGSHGYSAYGGGVALTYDDPANKFALTVAYSEVHSKGGLYRGGCYDDFRRRPGRWDW